MWAAREQGVSAGIAEDGGGGSAAEGSEIWDAKQSVRSRVCASTRANQCCRNVGDMEEAELDSYITFCEQALLGARRGKSDLSLFRTQGMT